MYEFKSIYMYFHCCFCDINWQTVWAAVGAISTTIAIVAIFYAGYQLRLQVWSKLQMIFTQKDFAEARGTIFQLLDKDVPDELTKEMEDAIKTVCRRMDEFCHFTRFFPKDRIIKYWGNPIGKAWGLLQDFVLEYERDKTRWQEKWKAFEDLGEKCLTEFSPEDIKYFKFKEKAPKIKELFKNETKE